MGSEHTWCFMSPDKEPISSQILDVKFQYFQDAEDQSLDIQEETASHIVASGSNTLAVFNTLSWDRGGLISVPAELRRGFRGIMDEDGLQVISQILSTGELLFKAEKVPAFGSKKYFLSMKDYISTATMASDNVLENDSVRVELDRGTGDIVSLRVNEVEFVDQRAACGINSYRYLLGEDAAEDAFRAENVQIRIKENGPLFASVEVHGEGKGCRQIFSEISIAEGSSAVHIKNMIDKIAIQEKEGVHYGFSFNIETPIIKVDLPWGLMEIEKDQLPGANRNWIAAQRWVEISNDRQGVTWCPVDAPIFEVGSMTANILGGATNSDKWIRKLNPDATIYSWALNNHWHTNFPLSQEGRLVFRYHLNPHLGSYSCGDANHFSMEQVHPLLVLPVEDDYKAHQLVSLEASEFISASVFKTLEDGKTSILRLRSHGDEDETVRLLWNEYEPASVSIIDLSNNQVQEEIENEVIVPARNFVSLKVIWR